MNYSLTLLIVLWLLFGISHSLLADLRVKNALYRTFSFTPTSFRVFYNLFAFVFLTALLYLQIVIPGTLLFERTVLTESLAFLVGSVGAIIMVLCVFKYFKQLSGIFRESVTPKLETGGLHQLVRHPLYLGTILFIAGLLLYFPYLKNAIAAVIITAYTIIGTFFEERKLLKTFGKAYGKYQEEVPMIFPWPGKRNKKSASVENS